MSELEKVQIRMVQEPSLYSPVSINTPLDAVRLLADTMKDYDREVFAVVNLRTDLKPINVNYVSVGALNEAMAHPREILKSAILTNSSSILMVHNHVSGKVEPSQEDIKVTDRMSQICGLLGIGLTDHIIIGPENEYFSFKEERRLPIPKIQFKSDIEDIKLDGIKVAETATFESTKKDIISFTVAECGEFHDRGELHENVTSLKEAIALFDEISPERLNGIPSIGIRVTKADSPEIFTEIDVMTAKRIDVDVLGYIPEIGENGQAQYAIAEMIHAFPEKEIIGEVPETIQKKVQMIESREKQSEQLKGVMDQLEKGVQDVFASDDYKNLLNVMAKMPKYSLNNMLLIAMQTEGKASMCQSFTGWKAMGRFVKKGEKGIKILAPTPYTIKREQDKIDQKTGKVEIDHNGEPLKETVDIKMNAFKVVSTFDVSQTDGKELPTLGVNELVGNIKGYETLFKALKDNCPVPIGFEDIKGGAKGYYHQIDKRIALQKGMSEVQTVKTLIHEMAHQKLHALPEESKEGIKSRNSKEVEAESIAYIVCQHYGINTSDYSFGYVAGWSDGKETTELKSSLMEIREAAADMIEAIDRSIEVLIDKTIETATAEFSKIYMEDPECGMLMMGEYASMLNYDSDMSTAALADAKKVVSAFMEKENPTVEEVSQVGKELLTICIHENEAFCFNGKDLLQPAKIDNYPDTVDVEKPDSDIKIADKKPSVRQKLKEEKEKIPKEKTPRKRKVKEAEACV